MVNELLCSGAAQNQLPEADLHLIFKGSGRDAKVVEVDGQLTGQHTADTPVGQVYQGRI